MGLKKIKTSKPKPLKIKDLLEAKKRKPKKVLDERQLDLLSRTLLPIQSIAIILGCDEDTIMNTPKYFTLLQKGREERKESLVQTMWFKAIEQKDTTMLIWLSKQHLGFREKQPDEATQIHFNIQTNEVPK